MINSIVFSKNRAAQLRLFLESVSINAPEVFKMNIIYTADDDKFGSGYEKIKAENILPGINWIKETSFKEDLVHSMDSSEFTCFFTDDDIFFRPIDLNSITLSLKNDDIFCFSLRLGENTKICYTMKARNVLFGQEDKGDHIVWDWTKHYLDFGYPLSVDGHIFRTKDIFKMVKKANFKNPNSFEAELQMFDNFPRSLMASFKHNILVNSPTNVVQQVYENRKGEQFGVSVEDLNEKLLLGEVIDLLNMDFSKIEGCHQELEFKYKKI